MVDAPRVGRRARDAATEALILVAAAAVFVSLHAAAGRDAVAAATHAATLQRVERALHLDVELAVNRWLVAHDALVPVAVVVYRSYYVVLLAVVVAVFVRHREAFGHLRRTLVAMAFLVLPVFFAMPVSPPRFALPGVVDVIARHDPVGGAASVDLGNGQNHFSAMPSMHVAWSAWCAYAVWSVLRRSHPRAAALAWAFPVLMVADILATGNHYVLDVVGSGVLLGLAVVAARLWARARAAAA